MHVRSETTLMCDCGHEVDTRLLAQDPFFPRTSNQGPGRSIGRSLDAHWTLIGRSIGHCIGRYENATRGTISQACVLKGFIYLNNVS